MSCLNTKSVHRSAFAAPAVENGLEGTDAAGCSHDHHRCLLRPLYSLFTLSLLSLLSVYSVFLSFCLSLSLFLCLSLTLSLSLSLSLSPSRSLAVSLSPSSCLRLRFFASCTFMLDRFFLASYRQYSRRVSLAIYLLFSLTTLLCCDIISSHRQQVHHFVFPNRYPVRFAACDALYRWNGLLRGRRQSAAASTEWTTNCARQVSSMVVPLIFCRYAQRFLFAAAFCLARPFSLMLS
jgi:hypothetical protein